MYICIKIYNFMSKMSGIFDRLKKGAGDAAHAAEKMARVRRLEGDIKDLEKQVDEHYTKIGEMTCSLKKTNINEDGKCVNFKVEGEK